jgi:4-amino-4-deoxy-L-arabinose transferase-like glycosyltransferase
VAERPRAVDDQPPPADAARVRRWPYWAALALVLGGALALRLWGIKQGLPFAYNADENSHFVPKAIGMFGHTLEPGAAAGNPYFSNPPAFTYLLHIVFAVWFGGRTGVSHATALHPQDVFVLARVTSAVLGTVAVWLLYLAGSRLFDRRVGILAAALMAVAFLPVFYSHLALNDVPTLAPLTLSLFGTAGVLRYGRPVDYLLAGIGLGLGCATKYTAGVVVAPLIAAVAVQYLAPGGERSAVVGLVIAGVAAIAAFLIANPYALLDFSAFRNGLAHQSSVSEDGTGKLGAGQHSGIGYYLWTFTWGLGWVPALAALGGAVMLWWDERRLIWLLVPAPLVFLVFMSIQGRYFGRWLMPVFPIVCLLAAYFALEVATRAAVRRPQLRPTLIALAAVALLAQGLVYSVHSGLVLSRADTRNQARAWMVAHVPVGARIVVEPVVPDAWVQDVGHPTLTTADGRRWKKYSALRSALAADGTLAAVAGPVVNIEDYEKTLSPLLIGLYERQGYCWIVSGSTQSGRALADPAQVPRAVAYYQALARNARVVYHASPYEAGQGPVAFNFDWTFDYYPLAYAHPGPDMTIFQLTGGRCAQPTATGAATTATGSGPAPSAAF